MNLQKAQRELKRRIRQGRAWIFRRERRLHAQALQAKDFSGLIVQHARTSIFTRQTKARRYTHNILVTQLLTDNKKSLAEAK